MDIGIKEEIGHSQIIEKYHKGNIEKIKKGRGLNLRIKKGSRKGKDLNRGKEIERENIGINVFDVNVKSVMRIGDL